MLDRASVIVLAGATGAGASLAPHDSVWTWLAPILCGCVAALLVRGIAITTPSKRKTTWLFEALVTALSVLITGVLVADHRLGIMEATMSGVGIGGLGVGVITIGKTTMTTILQSIAANIGGSKGT